MNRPSETKRCISCDEVRTLDRFQTKTLKDGTVSARPTCKDCSNRKTRQRRNAQRALKRIESNGNRVIIDDRMTERERQCRMRAVEGMGM